MTFWVVLFPSGLTSASCSNEVSHDLQVKLGYGVDLFALFKPGRVECGCHGIRCGAEQAAGSRPGA